MHFFQRFLSFLVLYVLAFNLVAQEPQGYYASAEGKKQAELKTSLYHIIKPHTQLGYYESSTYFKSTDWNPDGYFWDMYSNIKRTSWSGLNREHSLPKSWFGVASGQEESVPAGTDLHNLYPSNAEANSAKSNYALGEVSGSPVFSNGITKVGTNGLSGYSGIVFEPANEYKGDFARDYMYMVTCYEDYASRWQSTGTQSMLSGNTYPVFKPWAISMLLKWHRQDPVSTKEINRNNAVYKLQKNRNPYIDHPELVEYIWGNLTTELWSADGSLIGLRAPLVLEFNAQTKTLTMDVTKPEGSTYLIYSLSGMVVLDGKLNTNGTVDATKLHKGVYIVALYGNRQRKMGKLIIN